jgi:hypothetical protein
VFGWVEEQVAKILLVHSLRNPSRPAATDPCSDCRRSSAEPEF